MTRIREEEDHQVDKVLTVIHSLMDVAKLRQLLVSPPLITPNTYARQNVPLHDTTQLNSQPELPEGD